MHSVWLIDALQENAAAAIRSCLMLFGNILTFADVQQAAPISVPNVAIALVNRSTPNVQLQARTECMAVTELVNYIIYMHLAGTIMAEPDFLAFACVDPRTPAFPLFDGELATKLNHLLQHLPRCFKHPVGMN